MSFELVGFISVVLLVVYFLFARGVIKISGPTFVVIVLGTLVGLSLGALVNVTLLSRIPDPWGGWVQVIFNLFLVALMVNSFYGQSNTLMVVIDKIIGSLASIAQDKLPAGKRTTIAHNSIVMPEIIVDTSAVVDGRILEVARAGFLMGKLVVPRFVLDELHLISDSSDEMKRSRGKRGLDVLNELHKLDSVVVEVVDEDFMEENDVDSKIVKLARVRHGKLLTLDYNLNRVAKIQNVEVLNINELHDALRPVVLPGEELSVKLVQKGKDSTQAVGYLEDGTMVVVEDGRDYIGQEVTLVVTRMFQTAAGKMIFGRLEFEEED